MVREAPPLQLEQQHFGAQAIPSIRDLVCAERLDMGVADGLILCICDSKTDPGLP